MRSAIAAIGLVAWSLAPAPAGGTVTVSAAVSLASVLGELAHAYERQTGTLVVLNFGASNVLARQIAAGAGVDLFISAYAAPMDAVAAHLDPSSRVDLLANQLAVAVPADRPRRLADARDLADPAFRRIAIGDPAAVPAGIYARAYLQKIGIWDVVAPRLVPAGSVRLALAAVENGAADAALVYKTDLVAARRACAAFVVPPAEGPPIVYPAAVVRGGRNPAGGRDFLRFLQSVEAGVVFARAGFTRP